MGLVFVDTVAWIALANTRDSLHEAARATFKRISDSDTSFITSEFILIELGNALSSPDLRSRTAGFIRSLSESTSIEIIPSSTKLFNRGLDLFASRLDKNWGLVDCTSFVIMADRYIAEAFTQDHHFEQAGFTTLL